jgi:hypothetical protein
MKLTKNELDEILLDFDESLSKYNIFFETGTYVGDTISEMSKYFEKLYTIEIDDKLYDSVKVQYKHLTNVEFVKGDSSKMIKNVIIKLEKNTIFWLDGHFSGGKTGRGIYDCPLLSESKQINKDYKMDNALIIVDDYNLFNTNINEDWSDINKEKILTIFDNFQIVEKIINNRLILNIIRKK